MNLADTARRMDARLYHAWRAADMLADVMLHFYDGEVAHVFDPAEHDTGGGLALDKDPGAIKLDVDKWTDRLARQYLTTLYPDYGYVGEESFDPAGDDLKQELFWVVDPICGSMGYFKHTGSFGTSVALVDRRRGPILGVVNCPALGLAALGAVDGPDGGRIALSGAFRPRINNRGGSGPSLVMSSNRRDDPINRRFVELLDPAGTGFMEGIPPKAVQTMGGVYDLFVVLPRAMDGSRLKIWDYAASGAICRAAGMVMTDAHGREPDLTGADGIYYAEGLIMARDPRVAEAARQALAGLRRA